jgi:CubicO group peptidase (beta-lactamase class C family)
VAVVVDGDVVIDDGFGSADLASDRAMDRRTRTRAGSMAKLYVATCVLQLAEQQSVRLAAPVADYLPHLPLRNPLGGRPVTVHDLLTHQSGLATDTADAHIGRPPRLADYVAQELEQNVRREYGGVCANGRPAPRWTAPAGERVQYSSFGYAILALLVELVNPDRLGFRDYVRRFVFERLAMDFTAFPTWGDRTAMQARQLGLSVGYSSIGSVVVPSPWLSSAAYPSSDVVTTPGDQIRWLLAVLNDGKVGESEMLRPETVADMVTPQISIPQTAAHASWEAWGLGPGLRNVGTADACFGAFGAFPFGWWGDSRAYPCHRLAVVACCNRWDMPRWFNPPDASAPGLIADFVLGYVKHAQSGRRRSSSAVTWRWKRSYVAGVLMAERVRGLLGVTSGALPDALLDVACGGTDADLDAEGDLELEGFRAGLLDVAAVDPSPAGSLSLLAPGRLRITPEELALLSYELTGSGARPLPLPLAFYAECREAWTEAQRSA